jgi:hypothetical protein
MTRSKKLKEQKNLKAMDAKAKALMSPRKQESTSISKWWLKQVYASPKTCDECSFCMSKDDMYMEMPLYGDHGDGSFVVRIGCLCKKSLQGYRDFNRTRFLNFEDAVQEWNKQQKIEVTKDSDVSF